MAEDSAEADAGFARNMALTGRASSGAGDIATVS